MFVFELFAAVEQEEEDVREIHTVFQVSMISRGEADPVLSHGTEGIVSTVNSPRRQSGRIMRSRLTLTNLVFLPCSFACFEPSNGNTRLPPSESTSALLVMAESSGSTLLSN